MQIDKNKLNKWYDDKCPDRGWAIIYKRDGIIFKRFESDEKDELLSGDILELHLFDQDKEYRILTSRSLRYKDGIIEHIADFRDSNDSICMYKEKVMIENKFSDNLGINKINVYNHISYNDEGMAYIDDYRLNIEEECHE